MGKLKDQMVQGESSPGKGTLDGPETLEKCYNFFSEIGDRFNDASLGKKENGSRTGERNKGVRTRFLSGRSRELGEVLKFFQLRSGISNIGKEAERE